jgi:hypothetical protein
MVYLSGDGRHPQSLPHADRYRLEREGRFRTLPYARSEGLRGWLQSCREACCCVKVRAFLTNFISFVDGRFSTGSWGGASKTMETDIFVRHALRDEESLSLFLGAAKAFDAVAGRIISDFKQALAERLTQELRGLGDGWRVQDDSKDKVAQELGEMVAVSRAGWPGGRTWNESLRVILAYDKEMPNEVYFTARQEKKPMSDTVADHIAEALSAHCGRGKRDGVWWPFWYSSEDNLKDWTDPDVLLELWRKEDAIDHFAGRMLRMSLAVDWGVPARTARTGHAGSAPFPGPASESASRPRRGTARSRRRAALPASPARWP